MNLKEWMKLATRAEQEQLAMGARTSIGYLRQLSGGNRNGSAEMAINIKYFSGEIANKSKGRLKSVDMSSVCSPCSYCPFYQKCNKSKQ